MSRFVTYARSRARLWLATGLYVLQLPLQLGRRHAGKTRILVFHHLDDAPRFAAILKTITRKYNCISFADYQQGRIARDKINLILAFDDGYQSWHSVGLPLLKQFGIKPLLFVNSGFIGLPPEQAQQFCRERITTWPDSALNWEELRELAEAGADIGGHSHQHINMLETTDKTQLDELTADRNLLAQNLGHLPRNFAYPFGLYNIAAQNSAKWAGYDFAFTSDSGWLDASPSPLQLYRSNVGLRLPLMICAEVEGWGDVISALMRKLKKNTSTWSAA